MTRINESVSLNVKVIQRLACKFISTFLEALRVLMYKL